MFKVNAMFEDVVCLQLFSYSVRRRAKQWLSLPQGLTNTWSQLVEKFLTHYFPPQKSQSFTVVSIYSYKQLESEMLYDTWER